MGAMSKNEFAKFLTSMEPDRAAALLRPALAQVVTGLDESEKLDFLLSLLGSSERDKLASMVHL